MFGATVTTALLVSDLIALLLTRRPLQARRSGAFFNRAPLFLSFAPTAPAVGEQGRPTATLARVPRSTLASRRQEESPAETAGRRCRDANSPASCPPAAGHGW